MDEDTRFAIYILSSSSATVSLPFVVPYDCMIRDLMGVAGADPGDAQTVTVTNNTQSLTMGVLLWGSTLSTYAKGTWTADVTSGELQCNSGDVLLLTTSNGDAASLYHLILTLDAKCGAV